MPACDAAEISMLAERYMYTYIYMQADWVTGLKQKGDLGGENDTR
jgi:hypothetical protein